MEIMRSELEEMKNNYYDQIKGLKVQVVAVMVVVPKKYGVTLSKMLWGLGISINGSVGLS